MKYQRLTKEQFESLHQEFAKFLAAQSIDKKEWDALKSSKPELAEQELDVFSDLIWEGVLQKATFLENLSPNKWFLFELLDNEMKLIVVQVSESIDLNTVEGWNWLQAHWQEDSVEFLTASKQYSADRNSDVFQLIQQGAEITDGQRYKHIAQLLY